MCISDCKASPVACVLPKEKNQWAVWKCKEKGVIPASPWGMEGEGFEAENCVHKCLVI